MRIPKLAGLGLMSLAALAAALAACGTGAPNEGAPRAAQAAVSKQPSIKTTPVPGNPCGWIGEAEVQAIVGQLAGAPSVVRSAEDPTPMKGGGACLYPLALRPQIGTGEVILEVTLNSGVIVENAAGMMGERFRGELAAPGETVRESPSKSAASGGWDYQGTPVPLTFVGRLGHVGVTVAARTYDVSSDKLALLAARVRDRIPDLPFAEPVDPMLAELNAALGDRLPEPAGEGEDPCRLLTREEAEAVLGKLTAPPYRSSANSPLANPSGGGCTYLTSGHRALVLTPTWSDGKMMFGMAKGVGGIVSSVLPQESASGLKGSWEQATVSGATGTLYFLKDNRMLELDYRTSSTDRAGALKLAGLAVPRM